MSRPVYYVATTLDGFIADPNDSLDWLMREDQDESGPLNYAEFFANVGAVIMGGGCSLRAWPCPRPVRRIACGGEWEGSLGDRGRRPGQFADAGLLDELITFVAPVTLGAGRPLLPRRLDLELLQTHRNKALTASRYKVVGPLKESVQR